MTRPRRPTPQGRLALDPRPAHDERSIPTVRLHRQFWAATPQPRAEHKECPRSHGKRAPLGALVWPPGTEACLSHQQPGPRVEADETDQRDQSADCDRRMLPAQEREAHRCHDEARTTRNPEPAGGRWHSRRRQEQRSGHQQPDADETVTYGDSHQRRVEARDVRDQEGAESNRQKHPRADQRPAQPSQTSRTCARPLGAAPGQPAPLRAPSRSC
jgi:hypothetical protein